jgi:hypothetical protein
MSRTCTQRRAQPTTIVATVPGGRARHWQWRRDPRVHWRCSRAVSGSDSLQPSVPLTDPSKPSTTAHWHWHETCGRSYCSEGAALGSWAIPALVKPPQQPQSIVAITASGVVSDGGVARQRTLTSRTSRLAAAAPAIIQNTAVIHHDHCARARRQRKRTRNAPATGSAVTTAEAVCRRPAPAAPAVDATTVVQR